MMKAAVLLALLVAGPSASLADTTSSESNAAVQKVIQMLGDMSAKVKLEKNEEQVTFAEFETWCKNEIPQTQKSISKAAETIELLNAEITKLTTEAKVLGEEIAQLQKDVANFEGEKKKPINS